MNIAVLLCTYNGEKYIKQQLESIISQEVMPSVISVYDWGSSNQTVQILETFLSEVIALSEVNVEVKIVLKNSPIGVAAGFKIGILEMTMSSMSFDYIALCDQDDIWLPNKLSEYSNAIKSNPLVDLIFSDVSTIDSSGVTLISARNHVSPYFTPNLERFDESVVFANPVVGMTILISKKLSVIYANTKFESEIMHDWSLVLICKFLDLKTIYIDKPLVLYRQHSNNVLGNSSKSSKISLLLSMPKRVRVLRQQYDDFNSKLLTNRKFDYLFFIKNVSKSKVITPIYKSVILFFLILDFLLVKIRGDKC